MSSADSRSLPELPEEEWVPALRDFDMPDWGNVDGSLPGRIREMDLDDVVEEYVSQDDTVLDMGCAEGYTSVEIANISGADVVGVDVPEAFSRGTASNRYGDGPEPEYVSGLAPSLPVQEDAVDGVVALNSASYLVRNIGSLGSEYEEGASEDQRERLEDLHRGGMTRRLLEDFHRVTGEDGYVVLGEQTDSSYLVLEKDGDGWETADYGAFPDHEGETLHTRYEPWVLDEKVDHF